MLVTGGLGATPSVRMSVELLSSNGTRLCSLPDLPGQRFYHSQSGLLTCGGGYSNSESKSCVTFDGGRWKKSHTLGQSRYGHAAWASPQGVLLIGGDDGKGSKKSMKTTELLTDDGSTKPSFTLANKRT